MSSILIRICDSFLVLFINVRDKQGNKLTYQKGEATNCKRIKPHIILNDERLFYFLAPPARIELTTNP